MFVVYGLFYLRTYPFGSMAGLEEGTEEGTRTGTGTAMEVETAKPTCVIVLGMAGSGKTTFVQVRGI